MLLLQSFENYNFFYPVFKPIFGNLCVLLPFDTLVVVTLTWVKWFPMGSLPWVGGGLAFQLFDRSRLHSKCLPTVKFDFAWPNIILVVDWQENLRWRLKTTTTSCLHSY